MKRQRCQVCNEVIPKKPVIYVKCKKVCVRCYWRYKDKMTTANHLYKKYGDLEAYDEMLKEDAKKRL